MPLFEFHCEDCDREFELLVGLKEQPQCPSCESLKLEKLMSASAARVSSGSSLPMAGPACPPPSAGPCSPSCCRLP